MRQWLMTGHHDTVGWLGCVWLLLAVVQAIAQQSGLSQMPAANPAPFAVVELFTSEG